MANNPTKPKSYTAFNLAVAEYIDLEGKINYVLRASLHKDAFPTNGKHSEQRILTFLEDNNIPFQNVTNWYSEIQPCNHPKHVCREKLFENTPNAQISYTFKYENKNEKHRLFMNHKFFL